MIVPSLYFNTTQETSIMIDSFLMIGQSNMAGRGCIDEVPTLENSELLMLRNGRWRPLVEPVNYDRPFSGVSLAVSFAYEYSKKFKRTVGLIPAAEGGSSMLEWEPGGQLYTHAVYQCLLAKRISTIKGILWHQGESDCSDITNVKNYEKRLISLIDSLTFELGVKEIPFIAGELGDFLNNHPEGNYQYYMDINSVLRNMASKRSGFAAARATGLNSNPDGIHFDANSCRKFGIRYFTEFLAL